MNFLKNILILSFLILISCRGTTTKEPPIHLLQNMDNVGRLDPQSLNPASHIIEAEPYTDLNENGKWDPAEPFEDFNGNEVWDSEYDEFEKASTRNIPNGTVSTNGKILSNKDIKDMYENNTGSYRAKYFDLNSNDTLDVDEGEEYMDLEVSGIGSDGMFVDEIPDSYRPIDVNRGRERYNIFCSACHGVSGNGQGAVLGDKYNWTAVSPTNLIEISSREGAVDDVCKDGYIFDVITNGKGAMSGYAHQIPVEDRWMIVAYLRALSYAAGQNSCNQETFDKKSALKKLNEIGKEMLEEQILSDAFEYLVSKHSKEIQKYFGKEVMMDVQVIIECDVPDGVWGPASINRWKNWKKEKEAN